MLSLTRKESESVIFILDDGREVKVVISSIDSNRVQLNLSADKEIKIIRSELVNDNS